MGQHQTPNFLSRCTLDMEPSIYLIDCLDEDESRVPHFTYHATTSRIQANVRALPSAKSNMVISDYSHVSILDDRRVCAVHLREADGHCWRKKSQRSIAATERKTSRGTIHHLDICNRQGTFRDSYSTSALYLLCVFRLNKQASILKRQENLGMNNSQRAPQLWRHRRLLSQDYPMPARNTTK